MGLEQGAILSHLGDDNSAYVALLPKEVPSHPSYLGAC